MKEEQLEQLTNGLIALQNLFACTRYELDAVGCFLSELEDIEL